eukprot:30425-Pyramimonas_sp.AAC.1
MRKRRRNIPTRRTRGMMRTIGVVSSHRSCGVRCRIGKLALVTCINAQHPLLMRATVARHMHYYAPTGASEATPYHAICIDMQRALLL